MTPDAVRAAPKPPRANCATARVFAIHSSVACVERTTLAATAKALICRASRVHTEVMIRVETITMQSTDAARTARFWRDFLGYTLAPNHSDSVLLVGQGPSLLIQPTADAPDRGVIHLDLRPDDHAEAVTRAGELGAQPADVGQRGDEGWTVMTDPTGVLFCILESAGAHAARLERDPGTATCID